MVKTTYSINDIICNASDYCKNCNNRYIFKYWVVVFDGLGSIEEYQKKYKNAEDFIKTAVEYFLERVYKTKLEKEYTLTGKKIKWDKLFLDTKLPAELISAIRTFYYFTTNLNCVQYQNILTFGEKKLGNLGTSDS